MSGVNLDPSHAEGLAPVRDIYQELVRVTADHMASGDDQPWTEGEARTTVFARHQHPAQWTGHRCLRVLSGELDGHFEGRSGRGLGHDHTCFRGEGDPEGGGNLVESPPLRGGQRL